MPTVRELTPADAPALTALYAEYEWWADRECEEVRVALAATEVALGVEVEGDLVAAARVLSDYQYYATVFDVIVARAHRDEGVGETLVEAVVEHPALQGTPGLSLLCRRGLVSFYESVGFEIDDGEVDVPEGGTEDLVRMTYRHEEA